MESNEDRQQRLDDEARYERQAQGLLKLFAFEHLPEHLRIVSRQFHALAHSLDAELKRPSYQKVQMLDHLLLAKDAAVRANLS